MGIAIAGLASDGRVLAKYLRNACLNHRYVYESPMDTGRLVLQLSDSKNKKKTKFLRISNFNSKIKQKTFWCWSFSFWF
jgi:20S proteasome alpha/beta subunit